MKTINAIIIDDEPRARRVLNNLLLKNTLDITILAECNGIKPAVAKIKELKPDVVFLDIQMPHYSGYEIVNFFDKIDFEIVFVTAYDDYIMKALELCAIDYLVKPIDRERLSQALKKLQFRLDEKDRLSKYETLLNTINSKEFTQIVIPELGNRRVLNLKELIAIEADGAYSKFHLIQSKSIIASKNLKYFEDVLPKKGGFFRSHRGWIVNLKYIKTINRTKGTLNLENEIEAKLSRSRYSEFDLALS
jgi:two-component system LytT family response regulator